MVHTAQRIRFVGEVCIRILTKQRFSLVYPQQMTSFVVFQVFEIEFRSSEDSTNPIEGTYIQKINEKGKSKLNFIILMNRAHQMHTCFGACTELPEEKQFTYF